MDQIIGEFALDLVAPGCTPGAGWWGVRISFREDISQAMPYLNAALKPAEYYPGGNVLLWDNGGKRYAFRPHEIAIGPVEDREEAQRLGAEIVGMVRDIWNRRGEIEPDFRGRIIPPTVFQILKILPGTNCKECGCLTCMAYAAALIQGQAELSKCVLLAQESCVKLAGLLGKDTV